jgi:hypothetical protein
VTDLNALPAPLARVARPRRIAAALALLLVFAVCLPAGVTAAGAADQDAASGRADRVLIISLPQITWKDIEGVSLPNLDKLFAGSALAGMVTRTTGRTDLAEGYVSIGAGARTTAAGTSDDGDAFDANEVVGGETARRVFQQRTGTLVRHGIVHLGIAPIVAANDAERPDAEVGALANAIAPAGYSRAVIANGDTSIIDDEITAYHREAVGALMTEGGTVPGGIVSSNLLERAPRAAYGVRMNNTRAAAAFDAAWKPKSVVLVEASDVVRARSYKHLASTDQATHLVRAALVRTDDLVGRLLKRVDPAHDAVIVVGPQPPSKTQTITIASLRAPGVTSGLLESASTRRTGFVQLIDVAPTVLQLLGQPRYKPMTGRAFLIDPTSSSPAEVRSRLVEDLDAAVFRDRVLNPVAVIFILLELLLVVGASFALLRPQIDRRRAITRGIALSLLGFIPAVYLARLIPFERYPSVLFYGFILGVAIALGAIYRTIGRTRAIDSVIAALSVIVALLALDVMLGARLQLSSAFGYSPTVGIRLSGFGNISYAALAASALLLASLLAHRIGGRRGAWCGIAVMGLALVVDGVPFWGADVGGALSMVPAFGVTAWILLDRRRIPRVRTVAALAAATVLVVALLAAIDLSRPADKQTHLGRLVQQVSDEGPGIFVNVLRGKLDQNLSTVTRSVWGFMLLIVFGFLGYLWLKHRARVRALVQRIPELRSSAIGFIVLAVLGYALNDSGIVVPGIMLGVLAPVVIALLFDRAGWMAVAEAATAPPAAPPEPTPTPVPAPG